jgi:CRP-like cAMP-binding protein
MILAGGAVAAGAAAAAIAQAIKASGAIVSIEADDFLRVLQRAQAPLVVHALGGIFSTNYQYLTSYKGLAFFTKSASPLDLPSGCEVVLAKRIWIPG